MVTYRVIDAGNSPLHIGEILSVMQCWVFSKQYMFQVEVL